MKSRFAQPFTIHIRTLVFIFFIPAVSVFHVYFAVGLSLSQSKLNITIVIHSGWVKCNLGFCWVRPYIFLWETLPYKPGFRIKTMQNYSSRVAKKIKISVGYVVKKTPAPLAPIIDPYIPIFCPFDNRFVQKFTSKYQANTVCTIGNFGGPRPKEGTPTPKKSGLQGP